MTFKRNLFAVCVTISLTTIIILILWQLSLQSSSSPIVETNGINNTKVSKPIQRLKDGPKTAMDQCTVVTKIVFLKTHKTAGSSIQNMLMRFGMKRNLMFLIPQKSNYFGHPEQFNVKMVKQKLKEPFTYDIFTHHTRYNREEISKIMPQNARYFTILRDPVQLFESAYSFCNLEKTLNMTIEEFVWPNVSEAMDSRNTRGSGGKIGRNQMMFDLGFEVKDFEEDEKIADFIERLDSDFQLILITERLPESLILLKDLFCWNMNDIVIFHHNSRKAKYKKEITPELRHGIIRWNRADKYLYDHFLMILDKKIVEYGVEKMARDLVELESLTNKSYNYCVESTVDKSQLRGANKVSSPQVLGFKLKNEIIRWPTCADLTKEERWFTMEIQRYMKSYYKRNPITSRPTSRP